MLDQLTLNPAKTAFVPLVVQCAKGIATQSSAASVLRHSFAESTAMTMKPVVVLPKFFLSRIEFPNYRLLQGMWLSIETSGSEFVVSEPDLSLYGVGATIGEAIDEFVGMLIDLYDELSDSENVLSCSLRRQLEYLRSVITNQ